MVLSVLKEVSKIRLRINCPESLAWIHYEIIEQILREKKPLNQLKFRRMRNRNHVLLTQLPFYGMIKLIYKENAIDVTYLNFQEASSATSLNFTQ